MTREEHIQKAEELLREYRCEESGVGYGVWHPTPYELTLAGVHATLAVAMSAQPTGPMVEVETQPR